MLSRDRCTGTILPGAAGHARPATASSARRPGRRRPTSTRASAPRRLSLLEEGAQAFLALVAGTEAGGDPRQLLAVAGRLEHEALGGADGIGPRLERVAHDTCDRAGEIV